MVGVDLPTPGNTLAPRGQHGDQRDAPLRSPIKGHGQLTISGSCTSGPAVAFTRSPSSPWAAPG